MLPAAWATCSTWYHKQAIPAENTHLIEGLCQATYLQVVDDACGVGHMEHVVEHAGEALRNEQGDADVGLQRHQDAQACVAHAHPEHGGRLGVPVPAQRRSTSLLTSMSAYGSIAH